MKEKVLSQMKAYIDNKAVS
uniref:Uncharacterized protein n=1 Tax=Arundo donax TaxID=35708 RepID=A0A0A9BHW3_ARUDO